MPGPTLTRRSALPASTVLRAHREQTAGPARPEFPDPKVRVICSITDVHTVVPPNLLACYSSRVRHRPAGSLPQHVATKTTDHMLPEQVLREPRETRASWARREHPVRQVHRVHGETWGCRVPEARCVSPLVGLPFFFSALFLFLCCFVLFCLGLCLCFDLFLGGECSHWCYMMPFLH
jgi:hypothetical protein